LLALGGFLIVAGFVLRSTLGGDADLLDRGGGGGLSRLARLLDRFSCDLLRDRDRRFGKQLVSS
jgi:hypothetical protein